MPIKQRGESYFVSVCYGGVRKFGTAKTEIDAAKLEATLKAAAIEEAGGGSSSWTLGEALDKTMARVWKGTKNERNNARHIKELKRFFGAALPLEDLDTEQIAAYVEHLEGEGNSDSTINRKIATLGKALSTAVVYGGLKAKPSFAVLRRRESQGRIRFLSDAEELTILRLLDQWSKPDHKDFFCVLLDTGLRCGELLRAEARDLDKTNGMLAVWVNKADLPRSQPLTIRAKEILFRRATAYPTGPLFPYSPGWYDAQWFRLRGHMGLATDTQFVPHCLRHTFASRLVQRGVPIRTVQELMGHRDIKQTMRYAHLCPKNLSEAIKVLDSGSSGHSPQGTSGTTQVAATG